MRKLLKFLFILFLGVISCACVNVLAVHELNNNAAKLIEDGDLDGAISRLVASVDLDGNVYETRYNLASAYISKGECEKALEHAKVAVELMENEPVAHFTLGTAAQCASDNVFEKTDESGQKVAIKYNSQREKDDAQKLYIELLETANNAFNNYLTIVPHAEDAGNVNRLVKDNELKLKQISNKVVE